MSYQYYFPFMNQMMKPRMYCAPIYGLSTPATPVFSPIKNIQQPVTTFNKETINDEDGIEDVDQRTLFCANFNEKVTEELLYEVFLQAGPIEKVHIPKDNAGKRRSYGFVTYKYHSSPLYALRLFHGLALFNTKLDIKFQGKYNI